MKYCSNHNVPAIWKEGTSKTTGKPYGFWACPEKDNGDFCHAEIIERDSVKEAFQAEQNPDWDAIARGKVRHGVVAAVIENGGLEALKGKITQIEAIVEYIMSGQKPTQPSENES